MRTDWQLPHQFLQGNQLFTAQDFLQVGGMAAGSGHDDGLLFSFTWIINEDIEHETIQLGFRQRISSFLFERILSSQNKKRRG